LLKTTTSNKESRRTQIKASGKEIVMMLGDNHADFVDVPANATEGRRMDSCRALKDKWGKKWIMLPNPMYGDWQTSITRAATPTNKAAVLADRVAVISKDAR
jgi:5'-nucleotidase (lipoprotein e(P4) family)